MQMGASVGAEVGIDEGAITEDRQREGKVRRGA